MISTRYIVGDVFDVLPTLPEASVDLVMTSPPFLALRSYLPADHPDKAREIGSEATPAAYLDVLLDVVEACRRVLAPHGSLVFELGDTYSGSGGGGGDYSADGLRAGQSKFDGSGKRIRETRRESFVLTGIEPPPLRDTSMGWPLDKSLTLIPTLFSASLAYGRNLLRPEHTIEPWRIRNVIAWCRPNPPVGALADKFRPATSYLTVATMARDRWFDMEPVRGEYNERKVILGKVDTRDAARGEVGLSSANGNRDNNPNGAPLLDYWVIPTQPYKGSHYATFPEELPRRVILSMCPEKVCLTCGEPRRRITGDAKYVNARSGTEVSKESWQTGELNRQGAIGRDNGSLRVAETLGWTDCGHDAWRPGIVLDPFVGSGTTLKIALGNGRSSIGIDLDERNYELARNRVGMFLERG